jgi:hypothetical protein
MTWVKLDDGFYQHPKLVKVGPIGMALQVAAICYCNRNLTDGFVQAEVVPLLVADSEGAADRLVGARIWEVVEGGYQIHDYDQYQPTKAQIEAERKATADRVKRWRDNHSNNEVTPLHDRLERVINDAPVPVPVPVYEEDEEIDRDSSIKSSSSRLSTAREAIA